MKVLVTGIAGSGKTSIASELRCRGYNAYDIDSVSGISYAWDKHTAQKVETPNQLPADWGSNHNWVWDASVLKRFMREHSSKLSLYCGYADNQAIFYPLFDQIYVLSVDTSVLRDRLVIRQGNAYGKLPAERTSIIKYYPEFMNMSAIYGLKPLNTDKSVQETVTDLIDQVNSSRHQLINEGQ